jgi:predicted enzyme related to lactoylglutathione lyase
MPRPIHFEIHAENPARAATFYTELLGWTFQKWDGPMEYWTIVTGPDAQPGINGGLLRRHGTIDGTAVIAYVCTVDVTGIDAMLERAVALGGAIALPKMPIPGMGWLGYAKDTEGNIFGMMEMDAAAK